MKFFSMFYASLAITCAAAVAYADNVPVVDLSFDPASGAPRVLELGAGARVGEMSAPSGSGTIACDGTAAATCQFRGEAIPAGTWGDAVSASLWFRVKDFHDGKIGLGCSVKKAAGWGLSHLDVNVKTETSVFGDQSVGTGIDREIVPGRWHHLAYIYSASNRTFRAYFDGRIQSDYRVGHDVPTRVKDLPGKFGEKFRGEFADVRIWNKVVEDAVLLDFTPSDEAVADVARRFRELCDSSRHPAFRNWCEARISEAKSLHQDRPTTVQRWQRLQDALDLAPRLASWAGEVPDGSLLASAPLMCLQINPYSYEKRLPFVAPFDGHVLDKLHIRAAQGEHEAISFMLFPFKDLDGFELKVSDLKSDSAVLLSESVDLRVVKVWYAPSLSWDTYFAGGREFPKLLPELLLHDDTLVRVDENTRRNLLRIDYPSGSRYVDISVPGSTEQVESFNYVMEPVADSKALRPLPLEAGSFRQFWLKVSVPADAAPGEYKGVVAMVAGGNEVGRFPISIEVLPFSLPRARTRYDLSREYIGGMMHHCSLADHIAMGKSRADAERRLLAEFQNMAEHNILYPFGPSFDDPERDDLAVRQLELMREAGMPRTLIFGGSAMDMGWYSSDATPESDPEGFSTAIERFHERIERQMKLWDLHVGHRNVFFSGVDEAGPGGVRRQFPFFAEIKRLGARIFVTSGDFKDAGFAVDANDHPASIEPAAAAQWHSTGGRLFSYAAPFTGPENPDLWRRTKGMRLYMADYDGLAEYILYEGHNIWNEFVWGSGYKNFNIVYPTRDGLVDTVAWEALREGFDDVRYATLLRLLAAEGVKSSDNDLRDTSRKAVEWLEGFDPETADLDEMRSRMIDWILLMQRDLPGWKLPVEAFAESSAKSLSHPVKTSDEAALEEAKLLMQRNEYDRAVVALRQAAERNGASVEDRIEALTRLGECHRALRNRPQALKSYESIANIREANKLQRGRAFLATAATWLAPVERDARRTEEELRQARAALERAEAGGAVPVGDMAKAWLDFARALREAGSLADAAEICRRIAGIERLPANIRGEANILLGDCHNDLGEYKMAVYSYEQAVNSNAGTALRKIAAAARAAGDYSRAQAAYSDLIPLTGGKDMKWVARQLKVMTEVSKPAVEIRPENLNLRPSLDDDELDRLLNGM